MAIWEHKSCRIFIVTSILEMNFFHKRRNNRVMISVTDYGGIDVWQVFIPKDWNFWAWYDA